MTDPVLEIIGVLSPTLGVPVVGQVPANRPHQFVSVELTGLADHVPGLIHASFAIQAWAETTAKAASLAHQLRAALKTIDEQAAGRIVRVRVNQMYNWPDPDSRTARYQLVADTTLYDQ